MNLWLEACSNVSEARCISEVITAQLLIKQQPDAANKRAHVQRMRKWRRRRRIQEVRRSCCALIGQSKASVCYESSESEQHIQQYNTRAHIQEYYIECLSVSPNSHCKLNWLHPPTEQQRATYNSGLSPINQLRQSGATCMMSSMLSGNNAAMARNQGSADLTLSQWPRKRPLKERLHASVLWSQALVNLSGRMAYHSKQEFLYKFTCWQHAPHRTQFFGLRRMKMSRLKMKIDARRAAICECAEYTGSTGGDIPCIVAAARDCSASQNRIAWFRFNAIRLDHTAWQCVSHAASSAAACRRRCCWKQGLRRLTWQWLRATLSAPSKNTKTRPEMATEN